MLPSHFSMSDSPVTVDINVTEVKTEKPKKRQPSQNYPPLTREQCMVVANRIMELRKHKLEQVDIEAIFSVNGYENPRVIWQVTILYRGSVFKTPEQMVDWMMQYDADWLKNHPPTGPLNESKGTCNDCGTELRWKLVCTHCNKIIS